MVNTVVIQGNICNDLELRQTASGISCVRFNVAVNDGKETTYFIPVVAWRATADFILKYFRKGQQIAIEGKLTQRAYTGTDGIKRNVVEVVARTANFCGKKESPAAPQHAPTAAGGGDLDEYDDFISISANDEVPF